MSRNISAAYVLAVAAACLSSCALAADLPKSGTYAAHFGWTFSGQVQELGSKPDSLCWCGDRGHIQ